MALALDTFVEQLCASGVLPAPEVQALRAEHAPADSEQFARLLVRLKLLTAYQAKQVYAGKARALVLGNYLILEKLGQGGMGMVLKARHRRMDRIVALKVLAPEVVQDQEMMARFRREVKAAARLEHANIVIAYDADEARGTHFFVMQYIEGSDLSQIVKTKGPLPVAQALDCVLQAARGLEFAHKHGVIHRDIKPANLLLDNGGTVKLLDLGLARIEGDTGTNADLTSTGEVMGTVDYMAPEQALDTRTADARSDVYSLGITLWYLLVGRPAYEGASLMKRLFAHREAPIPALQAVRTDIPDVVEALFRKMVAKQPAQRFQTMSEVIAAVQACQYVDQPDPLSGLSSRTEDSKLSEFLGNFREDSVIRSSGTKSKVLGMASLSGDVTVDAAQSEANTIVVPATESTRRTQRANAKSAWWLDRRVQAAGGAVLLLAAVFLFRPGSTNTDTVSKADSLSARKRIAASSTKPHPTKLIPIPTTSVGPNDETSVFKPRGGAEIAALLASPDFEFGPPKNLGPGVNSAYQEQMVRISDDECRVYFGRGDGNLYCSERRRREDPFGPAKFVAERSRSSPGEDFSSDGLQFVEATATDKLEQVLLSTRTSLQDPFDTPVLLTDPVNGPFNNRHPILSSDGLTLLLCSTRQNGGEIWMFTREARDKPFGNAWRLSNVNTQLWDMPHWVSNDRCAIIASAQHEAMRHYRMFSRSSGGGVFGNEQPLRTPYDSFNLYSGAGDYRLSRDGQRIYFQTSTPTDGFGHQDLYVCELLPRVRPSGSPPVAKAPFDVAQARQHQEAWARYLGVPIEYTNSLGMKFRLIPPGEFEMGPTASELEAQLNVWRDNEHWTTHLNSAVPQHHVVLTEPWYLGVHEVTQSQFEKVLERNPSDCSPTGDFKDRVAGKNTADYPVERTQWHDASEFCEKLSLKEQLRPCSFRSGGETVPLFGNGYRLPTEAEWEFACRAGTITRYWSGQNDSNEISWSIANSGDVSHPVGTRAANPFGLFDTHGNAWEWVQDWWEPEIYGRSEGRPAVNPGGWMTLGTQRAFRGGSCFNYGSLGESATRNSAKPDVNYRGSMIGFRAALSVEAVKQLLASKK